jgi:hypothetical protein
MSNQANRIYSYYSATCGLGPQYFVKYLQGDVCPQRKMVLYYRLTISPTDISDNASRTTFVTDPSAPDIYRGISNRYMTERNFIDYNTNILTFVGSRTPKNPTLTPTLPPNLQVPDIYNETVNISIEPYESNYIQASANYLDDGSTFETTVSSVNYTVTAASGIFEGFTNVKIDYFNNGNPPGYKNLGPVRIVTIT